jgi:hypothetical protein
MSEFEIRTPPQMQSADRPLEVKHLLNIPSAASFVPYENAPMHFASPIEDTYGEIFSMIRSVSLIKDELRNTFVSFLNSKSSESINKDQHPSSVFDLKASQVSKELKEEHAKGEGLIRKLDQMEFHLK